MQLASANLTMLTSTKSHPNANYDTYMNTRAGTNPNLNGPNRRQSNIDLGGGGNKPSGPDVVDDVLEELHDGAAAEEAGAREVAELRGEQRG